MAIEPRRGCGFRKTGGLYLVGDNQGQPCCRLPIILHVCPACKVLSAYAGSDPKAFADPPLGQDLASAQFGRGADIIYHAAGKTGDGVIAAARQREARAIGVDSDQHDTAPCCVVTSMIKRVDVGVIDLIDVFIEKAVMERGLQAMAANNRARALKCLAFGFATYPEVAVKQPKTYALAGLLAIGPAGGWAAKRLYDLYRARKS